MQVCLFSHVFAGAVRYCEAKEMIRKLCEESDFDNADGLSDWNSCLGESDSCSTTSGFESASEGWSDEEPWGADLDFELPMAVPGEEVAVSRPAAWFGTRVSPIQGSASVLKETSRRLLSMTRLLTMG